MSQLETTLNTIRAAFAENALPETQSQGIAALELLLSALQGAQTGPESPPPEPSIPETPKPAQSGPAASPAKPAPSPDLLDGVIGFLKSQLDAEDRAEIEQTSVETGFSVPFINF